MTPGILSGKIQQWYSVRLRIYSWFMKYCHPKLVSAGVIAGDVGRRQQCTIQEGQTQPSLDDDATHFTQELEPDGQSKLDGEEPPQPSLLELKPLPPGLKFAFLHNNRATPVVISDKLIESETRQLIAVLEKHDPSLGILCKT